MTSQAVRRPPGLSRPVDSQLLLDCIDVAEQAPAGGNTSIRGWVIVRDQAVKDQLAELYQQTAGGWMSGLAAQLAGHPPRK